MRKLTLGAALVAPAFFMNVASATSAVPESWAGAGIVSETPGIAAYLLDLPMVGPGFPYVSEGNHSASISNELAAAAGRANDTLGAEASASGPSGALGAAFVTSTFHVGPGGPLVESAWSVDGSLAAYGDAWAGAAIGIVGWVGDFETAYDDDEIGTFLFKSLTTDDFPEEFDEVAFKASGDYSIDFGEYEGYMTIAAFIVAGAAADEGGLASADFLNTFIPNLPPPSAVPVPAAVWLFGSAIVGLFGFNRRKIAA